MTPLLDHSAIKQKRRFVRKANLQNSQQRLFQVGLSSYFFNCFIPSDGEFFDLAHNGFLTCGIPDGDSFVLTGGLLHNFVTRLTRMGAWVCGCAPRWVVLVGNIPPVIVASSSSSILVVEAVECQ